MWSMTMTATSSLSSLDHPGLDRVTKAATPLSADRDSGVAGKRGYLVLRPQP